MHSNICRIKSPHIDPLLRKKAQPSFSRITIWRILILGKMKHDRIGTLDETIKGHEWGHIWVAERKHGGRFMGEI